MLHVTRPTAQITVQIPVGHCSSVLRASRAYLLAESIKGGSTGAAAPNLFSCLIKLGGLQVQT